MLLRPLAYVSGKGCVYILCSLGVLFESKLSFTKQVNSVIKSCFVNLCDMHHTGHFFSFDVSVMVANVLVSSHLDYCKSLFHNFSFKNIIRLQNIQNLPTILQSLNLFTGFCKAINHLQNLGTRIQVPHHWKAKIFGLIFDSVYMYSVYFPQGSSL